MKAERSGPRPSPAQAAFGTEAADLAAPPAHWLLGHLPALRSDVLAFLEEVPRTYGDVVPLRFAGYPALLLSHPRHFEQVLVRESRKFHKPPRFRRAVRSVFGDGLFANQGPDWLRRRRHVQAALDELAWESYEQAVSEVVRGTLAEWKDHGTADLVARMTELALRIRIRTTLGTELPGALAIAGETITAFMDDFARQMRNPLAGPRWLPGARNRRFRRALTGWWSLIDRSIRDFSDSSGDGSTVLGNLTRRMAPAEADGLTAGELREELATWILTGVDTVANTLAWTVYLIARHPAIGRALGATARADRVSGSQEARESDRQPGLAATLREAMRLYPQAYILGRKAVVPFEIDGHAFRAGTTVILNQWSISRDARWFAEPRRFKPERFDPGRREFSRRSEERSSVPPPAVLFPFGAGPRACAGRAAAWRELPLVLASLLEHFEIRLADRIDAPPVRPAPSLTLRPAGEIRCHFERRLARPTNR